MSCAVVLYSTYGYGAYLVLSPKAPHNNIERVTHRFPILQFNPEIDASIQETASRLVLQLSGNTELSSIVKKPNSKEFKQHCLYLTHKGKHYFCLKCHQSDIKVSYTTDQRQASWMNMRSLREVAFEDCAWLTKTLPVSTVTTQSEKRKHHSV